VHLLARLFLVLVGILRCDVEDHVHGQVFQHEKGARQVRRDPQDELDGHNVFPLGKITLSRVVIVPRYHLNYVYREPSSR